MPTSNKSGDFFCTKCGNKRSYTESIPWGFGSSFTDVMSCEPCSKCGNRSIYHKGGKYQEPGTTIMEAFNDMRHLVKCPKKHKNLQGSQYCEECGLMI
jgi:hypothetical protein